MSTTLAKPSEIERKWYVIDAAGKPLGRVAAQAAVLLRGKHKVTYTPNVDCGDHVVIINCDKAVLTGSPIRQELLEGDAEKARSFTGFTSDKPVILVIGGSLGAVAVNNAVRSNLPELLKDFQIIHLCGRGKLDPTLNNLNGYVQYEYIKDELKDLFALTDIVISRAGANAICELLALHKPNLLIPLSANASRGDQILNARSFERQGFSMVLEEEDITNEKFLSCVHTLYENRQQYIEAMSKSHQQNSIDTIIDLIESAVNE